ncbi:methyl-accepting chemotaxis sensory transducer [Candidatus Desulforudis audaxviator MP104C]|uniref:Methyl-accepting chemotaxis sensory transducer n=1 Tax=Desulforudis audaxviator (strain MP104C) TaxID=477974 RepID=B1I2Z9_DESAP|nr:methyl-accepting chemotaxis sensory transducer [Candidatus Desulforudis audaxviator MP104C]AZK59346.1 Methyl-accepting chemotaxis protein [Candidatus Desulforudis audaxviator]
MKEVPVVNIRQKILTGYLIVFLACVFTGGFALHSMYKMKATYTNLIENRVHLVHETQNLLLAFEYKVLMMRTYFLTGLPEWKEEFLNQSARTMQALEELEDQITTDAERAVFLPLSQSIRSFDDNYATPQLAVREDPALTEAEKMARIKELTVQQRGTVRRVISQGQDFINFQQKLLNATVAESAAWVSLVTAFTAVLLSVSLLLGLGAAVYISRTISEPLRRLEEAAELVGTGDLTAGETGVLSHDEVGRLARSFARMTEHFRRLVERVRWATDSVIKQSAELGASAREATASAAATNEAVEELSVRITSIVRSASAVEEKIRKVSKQAVEVEEAARKMRKQMDVTSMVAERANLAVTQMIARLDDIGKVVRFSTDLAVQAGSLAREVARESAYMYRPDETGAESTEGGAGVCAPCPPEPFLALAAETEKRSQQTLAAAAEISGLVEDLRAAAQDVAVALAEERGFIVQNHGLARDVAGSLPDVVSAVHVMSEYFREVSIFIMNVMQHMEAISDGVEKQSDLITDIGEAASTLDSAARELQEAISALKM